MLMPEVKAMDSKDFVARLMRSPLAAEMLAQDAAERVAKRKDAAERITAVHVAADREVEVLSRDITKASEKVARLGDELVQAQEMRGHLHRRRADVENKRFSTVRPLQVMLERTAPVAVIDFCSELRWMGHSVALALQVPRPVQKDKFDFDFGAKEQKFDAEMASMAGFQARLKRVLTAAEALIYQPAADVENRISELRRELAVPPTIAAGWAEVSSHLISIGRGRVQSQ